MTMTMTMTLDDQIQSLLAGAPQDGQTPLLMEIITPLLKELALQLNHTEYYILQNAEGRWMMTTLSHREDLKPDKTVIYAYATLADAQLNPHARVENTVMGNNVMGNTVMANNAMGNAVMANNVMGNNAMANNAMADVMAIPTPVIMIIFQLLALQPVTSLLFFDTPGNRKDALEIRRDDIQNLVKAQLKLYQQAQTSHSIPPNLA